MSTFTRSSQSDRPVSTRTLALLAGWGVLVWFAVFLTVRGAGHVLLAPENERFVAGFFAAVVPLMGLVTYPVYWQLSIPVHARASAAAAMSIPGLFLDVLLVEYAAVAFPSMGAGAVRNFAAILLFGYGVVLATGFAHRGLVD